VSPFSLALATLCNLPGAPPGALTWDSLRNFPRVLLNYTPLPLSLIEKDAQVASRDTQPDVPPEINAAEKLARIRAKSMPIPHHKKGIRVYQNAERKIPDEHRSRFPVIQELFRRNVQQTPKFSDSMEFITYELRMCGLSEVDATPSILVFCPAKLLKALKSLLTKDRLKAQYHPEEDKAAHLPRFNLYFWAQTMELLWSALVKYGTATHSQEDGVPDSLCGAQVVFDKGEQRCSTLACTLFVNGDCYGLTTAHVIPESPPSPICDTSVGLELDDDEGTESEDDDEYDLPDEVGMAETASRPGPRESASIIGEQETAPNPDTQHPSTSYASMECEVHMPPHTADWQSRHANLDWALLKIRDPSLWLPNVYLDPRTDKPVKISGIATAVQANRPVHIVSSGAICRYGSISHTLVYSSSGRHPKGAMLWAVDSWDQRGSCE